MNNNYTTNLNLGPNQYTHIDLPIAKDDYSSTTDKTVTYADFINFREVLNFGYGNVNQNGKRVTIGGSTVGDTWLDVLKQIEKLFEALHQRILALENAPIILETIEWESITASSIEGSNPSWPRIKCTWSDSSITYVNVGATGVSTPTTNITTSTSAGTYSGIKVTYNGKTTTNSLTYTVNVKTISNINWATTTGSSNAGTAVNTSTITNKITVLYNNGTISSVNVSSINVFTNNACTTTAPSTWYNTPGTYYIKGVYDGKTTTNYITWTINNVITYYLYVGTTKPTSLSQASTVASYPAEQTYTNNSGAKSHIFVLTNSDKNVIFIEPSENSPITQVPVDTTTISGYKIFETAVGVANTKQVKIRIS